LPRWSAFDGGIFIACGRGTIFYCVDRDGLIRLLRAFESVGLEYALIGATAIGFHGLVRATEDVDLFVRATPENVNRLRAALYELKKGTIRPLDRQDAAAFQPVGRGLRCLSRNSGRSPK
jgi:Nucleotidyl transferase AbiEii toxin, Type IV TA system